MSIVYCEFCEKRIDTDYDAEHFIDGTEHCLEQVQNNAPDLLEEVEKALRIYEILKEKGHEMKAHIKQAKEVIKKATKI